jgi:DNA invertase Pin-like site-specific DNA recombinase
MGQAMSTTVSRRRQRPETVAQAGAREELTRIGVQRKIKLKEVEDISRRASEMHAAERKRARALHREANRAVVDSVTDARDLGMAYLDIAAALGMSTQTLRQIKASVAEWNEEEGEL